MLFSETFITLRHGALVCVASLADLILSQSICVHIKKQDIRGVFWKYGLCEFRYHPRIKPSQACRGHRHPSDPNRGLQVLQIHYTLPVQDCSACNIHRVWCVVVLVTVSSKTTDHGECLDFSAFLVIALYANRNRRALKFSALVRTIVAEATIYFIAMVTAQTFILLSFTLMEVRPFTDFPLRLAMVKHNHSRV